ncbi:MAG TPA: alpha/beta fold hydrolase [Stellaceae bacterium]|nr:alpha/beta fold hydrolase [Stellaceae bacterium]
MEQARLIPPAALEGLSFAPFAPRAPWWGGDLQSLSNYLRPRARLHGYSAERLILPLDDGSGDRLAATLNRPAPGAPPLPLVVLIHGLGGDELSAYMRRSAVHFCAHGYPVLRLNLRGAGPSRPFCRLQYHGGRSDDFAMALAALPEPLASQGIVAIGFSLGGNMLLKFLGERGAAARVRAAVSVSAPIDLAATSRHMQRRRNAPYQAYLMRDIRREAAAPAAVLSPEERRVLGRVRSIREFDELFTAPHNGFAGADDYYARNAAQNFLGTIAVPTLVIHALDDPWVPSDPYRAVDWSGNPHLVPLLPKQGGHIGFQGSDPPTSWHDAAIARFLVAALSRR